METDNLVQKVKLTSSEDEEDSGDKIPERDQIKDDLDENLENSMTEARKQWLADYIDGLVSKAIATGQKEAELRGGSKMKMMMMGVLASTIFSLASASGVLYMMFG